MIGLAIEFSLVIAGFLYVWRKQIRERQRLRERASQLDLDFDRDGNRGGSES